MTTLNAITIAKVAKLLPMLTSDKDGEVIATARAVVRVLAKEGATVHDIAAKLEAQPTERIVYRDRVVYRDVPKAEPKKRKPRKAKAPKATPPPSEPERDPNNDYTITSRDITRDGLSVLEAGGLTANEESFIESIMRQARYGGDSFRMTFRQADWWRRILDDSGVIDPRQPREAA
ncbi:hypothetical protein [Aureimonas psammosilenae]|uniref:hypothetical protein n=1 Tax=Aureimonas psammosilenae TaxID=2495496 RepID=UPI0012608955|nr:hypothetical protein [Aureimonas psammosilenae]